DAAHIAAASQVRLAIALDHLPTLGGLEPDAAARSGDEYELLVASPRDIDAAEFERRFELPLTAIGCAEAHDGPHDHRARRSHCRTVALRCAHSAGQLSGPRAARLVQSGAVGIGGSPYGAQSRAHRRAQ